MSHSIRKWSFYNYGTRCVGYLPIGGSRGLLKNGIAWGCMHVQLTLLLPGFEVKRQADVWAAAYSVFFIYNPCGKMARQQGAHHHLGSSSVCASCHIYTLTDLPDGATKRGLYHNKHNRRSRWLCCHPKCVQWSGPACTKKRKMHFLWFSTG